MTNIKICHGVYSHLKKSKKNVIIIKNKSEENLYIMRKLFAFTLAEVMLAMTIVGVIAAMTIPTLHYQRVKKEYTAKLKNFYSRMENAILDMEMDKGSFRDMRKPAQGDGFAWYKDNIDPYFGHQFVDNTNKRIYYKDGSMLLTFYTGGCLDVDYDVNGDRPPNDQGYDRHRFLYCFTDADRVAWFGNKEVFFGTYGSGQNEAGTSRATMINKCTSEKSWCTKLLQNDQWEFKGDYPLKF